jgi:amino acid transporter
MLLVLICFILGPVFFLVVLPEKFGVNPITDSNFLPYIRGAVIVFVTFMGWQIFWVSVADFKNGKSKYDLGIKGSTNHRSVRRE